jgi:hypothetical protein
MLTSPASQQARGAQVGQRAELARYKLSNGERIVHGRRVNGVARVLDRPARGSTRAFGTERRLEQLVDGV